MILKLILLSSFSIAVNSAEPPAKTGVKYKSAKDVDFEQLLIEGQLKRPEIMVVTGDATDATNGLLRLRDNFLDRAANDIGEEIK
ncbi:MAG: hypothetical protein AABZ06_07555 [Bdellovibrionota bacterium]